MPTAAYIHIPFCNQICHYCDFNKVFIQRQPVDEYIDFLEQEIIHTIHNTEKKKMKTVFVGGGTPTALTVSQLERLLQIIHKHLIIDSTTEFTFEANPDDATEEKLQLLLDGGVNRLSFGVQSFNDELLKSIGRSHHSKDVYNAISRAQEMGFDNISIDLMYALPKQTIQDFRETLRQAFSLGIQHFSGYSLIVEPKTVFYQLMNKGKLALPTQEEEAEMYQLLMDEMEKHGYRQYEISNFAKPGYESKHNLTYWDNNEYYGFGAGSHGYVASKRNANYGPLKKYSEPLKEGKLPYMESNEVTKEEAMQEEMFLGLRKMQGVSKSVFHQKFGIDIKEIFGVQVNELKERRLLEEDYKYLRLTQEGKFLGNEVFQLFI